MRCKHWQTKSGFYNPCIIAILDLYDMFCCCRGHPAHCKLNLCQPKMYLDNVKHDFCGAQGSDVKLPKLRATEVHLKKQTNQEPNILNMLFTKGTGTHTD